MLADVCSCPLGHKLRHLVPIVGHFAFNLEVFVKPSGQREQQGGLA
uniref:Uncharacterized protein n=1 Tax=Arundo donax TaxID=35708 RepID=A0A0A9GRH0_ARUDO